MPNGLLDDLLIKGIDLFNSGRYFEAHEIWEDLWRATPAGEMKLYYQALIQAAVGLYHLRRGNLIGATGQLGKSIDKLRRYPANWAGIDNADLLRHLEARRNSGADAEIVRILRR